ncbi:DEAD/DEAH box helicase [Candidatus Woesearchaeota archaeon]|nr:DEAD/DEAH box helicase [Candidatus Woesearchaeota archaeon]
MEFNFSSKTLAMPHQIEAIEFIKGNKNLALFDEQGLGKSKIVISALCEDLKNKIIDSVLILCKKTLVKTWKNELLKHSYLKINVIVGSKQNRGRSFMHFSHFHIINYDSFVQELDKIKLFLGLYKFAIVLDESQVIKNPFSRITKSVLDIKDLGVKRIIITGTPIANRPEDLWSQFYFLDNGETLGEDFKEFQKNFRIKLKGETSLKKYESILSSIKQKINKISIRRTKDVLELPEKVYSEVFVVLEDEQKRMYERLREELYLELKDIDNNLILEKIDNYLVKLLRLTQIASNPSLLEEGYKDTPAKFKELDKIIKDILDKNEKVIIWTSFRGNIRTLRKRYQNYGALMLFGEIPMAERDDIIEKFMQNPEIKILIANPSAAKEGLTLTSANNAIYLDRSFKMDDYLQSQDRIHRIGQQKKCQIIKLIAKDTIDEYTDEILEKKHLLAQFALGDINHIHERDKFLTKAELLKILG